MEEAVELYDYLPVWFRTPEEREYINFLCTSFETNYREDKFQFAFLAYHMLTMSLVYFKIWQIKSVRPKDFEKSLIGFNKDIEKAFLCATSPFIFSKVPERSILRLLKLVGCDNSKVGKYAKLVDDRNAMAHPNGHISLKTKDILESKIRNVLKVVDEIQSHSKIIVESCYQDFLCQSSDTEEPEYEDDSDQIREILIHSNYMSNKDIAFCCDFDLSKLDISSRSDRVNSLHNSLLKDYGPE